MSLLRQVITQMKPLCRCAVYTGARAMSGTTPCGQKIKVGDAVPPGYLFEKDPCNRVNLVEHLCCNTCGKRTVIVGVPGAFVPECTHVHLKGFVEKAHDFCCKDTEVVFISCNDPFVMDAWGRSQKADGKIKMLADPAACFTKKIGMDIDLIDALGTIRSRRYAMVVENGKVAELLEEPDGTSITITDAASVLKKL